MFRRPSIFYGWYVVVTAIVGHTLIYGVRYSFSVFFSPILDEFSWQRGSTAVMLSLNILIYGLLAPVAGSLADRWKPRRVVVIGISILALAVAGCAFAYKLWHFYLLFGILAPIGIAFCGSPLLNPTVINWFAKRRGLALGVAQIGGSFSLVYAGMLAQFTISQLGWRHAYFVLAGILIVVLLPLYLLFFYYHPKDRGLTPYGAVEPSTEELKTIANPRARDWTIGNAMRTHQLWLLILSQFFYWGIGNILVLAHQVKFVEDVGYSSFFAASIFALFGISSAVGQLSASLSDLIGREKTVTFATILAIGALVALISVKDTTQPWLLYVYATCSGYATGLFSPTVVAGAADLFHGRHFGAIAALLLTGLGVGGAIGPWLGGYVYDISGSYNSAFLVSIVCFGLACISFWIAAPRKAVSLRAKT